MHTTPLYSALLAAALIVAFSSKSAAGVPFETLSLSQQTLDQYRWNNRPVLVFAASERDPSHIKQLEILRANRSGLAERDIVVLSDVDARASRELRDTLQIDDFEVVLIGKDGGVKLRSKTPVSLESLFARIDAMPMRLQEMRSKPRAD